MLDDASQQVSTGAHANGAGALQEQSGCGKFFSLQVVTFELPTFRLIFLHRNDVRFVNSNLIRSSLKRSRSTFLVTDTPNPHGLLFRHGQFASLSVQRDCSSPNRTEVDRRLMFVCSHEQGRLFAGIAGRRDHAIFRCGKMFHIRGNWMSA